MRKALWLSVVVLAGCGGSQPAAAPRPTATATATAEPPSVLIGCTGFKQGWKQIRPSGVYAVVKGSGPTVDDRAIDAL